MISPPTEETYQLMFAMAIFLLILALGCLVYIHQIARELVAKQSKTISPRQPPTTPYIEPSKLRQAGTPEARLDELLKQLAVRFPNAVSEMDSCPHEIAYLIAIDDMQSELQELRKFVRDRWRPSWEK